MFLCSEIFYVRVGFTRILNMLTKEEQEKGCPRASEGVSQHIVFVRPAASFLRRLRSLGKLR